MASFGLLHVEVVPLLQRYLVISAAIIVVLDLNLNLFVEKISIFIVLAAQIADGLLDFGISAFEPALQLVLVEFVDALLDEICLVETA